MGRRELGPYQLDAEIQRGIVNQLWRGTRRSDGAPVLVQFPVGDRKKELTLARYSRELQVLQTLASAATLNGLELRRSDEPMLVFSDVGACQTLEARLASGRIDDLDEFFSIAISLAEAVGELHQKGFVHSGLTTQNVLLPEGRPCVLKGFTRASRFPECQPLDVQDLRDDSTALAHISPEQTGRINRTVDYRTDLYSLGVMYHRMLSGSYPLYASGLIGWFHAHIALPPKDLLETRRGVPPDLTKVIAALLQKNAENRYQNAFAVAEDLRLIAAGKPLDEVNTAGPSAGRFVLSPRIYGRDQEIGVVLDTFERAAEGGRELLLVSGPSGVGKTALVQETQRPLLERSGLICTGKFGQFGRATPHVAFRDAIIDLVDQLLERPPDDREQLRKQLGLDLGPQLAVVHDRIPAIASLVGPQPTPPPLSSADAQARFHAAVGSLLAALARPERPLVVFIDDVQWIDPASLQLVEDLLRAPALHHFMLVAAYRDNEVHAQHALSATTARLAKEERVTTIQLGPLGPEDIFHLLHDSFRGHVDDCRAMTKVVLEKTDGSPFFARQFLRGLHDEGILQFDFRARRWTCDRVAAASVQVSENVVDLMVGRLVTLPPETQRALALASCVGASFDLVTLAKAHDRPPSEEHRALLPALHEGLVRGIGPGQKWMELGGDADDLVNQNAAELHYRFAHDRIQQAANTLVDPEARPRVHQTLARVLSALPQREDTVYAIANHTNNALGIISGPKELLDAAQINLAAARAAEKAGAHTTMHHHCTAALAVYARPACPKDREVGLEIHRSLGVANMLLGDPAAAATAYQRALTHCESVFDRLSVNMLRMEMNVAQGQVQTALALLIDMLSELDIDLSRANVAEVARDAPAAIRAARAGRSIEDIVAGPTLDDPLDAALVALVGRGIDTAFMNGRDWVVATTSVAVGRCLQRGLVPAASICFSTYGLTDAEPPSADGIRTRFDYGRVGAGIAARFDEAAWQSAANVSNPHHYGLPFHQAIERFDYAARVGEESSNLTWSAYGAVRALFMRLTAGVPLDVIDSLAHDANTRLLRWQRLVSQACVASLQALIHGLQVGGPEPWRLGGPKNEHHLDHQATQMGPWAACKHHAARQILAVLWGRIDLAREATDALQEVRHALQGMSHELLHDVFEALIIVHESLAAPGALGPEVAARLSTIEQRLASHAAVNSDFEPAHRLVQGLTACHDQTGDRVTELLCRAADCAAAHGQSHLEAVAYEQAALCEERQSHASMARLFGQQAAAAYERWGAAAKARSLRQRYPAPHAHAPGPVRPPPSPAEGGRRAAPPTEALAIPDAESLLKACRAISSQIRIDDLLRTQIEILMENLGAQEGMLLLRDGDALLLEVESKATATGLRTRRVHAALVDDDARRALIDHVLRTGHTVDIDEVKPGAPFGVDGFPSDPASVLCCPLRQKGAVVGVVYLENRDIQHAFTPASSALEFLLAQIATSLENAQLYEDLARQAKQRARAQEVLQVERDYSREIIEASPLIVCVVSPAGTIRSINRAAEVATGRTREALVGAAWADVFCASPAEGSDTTRLPQLLLEDGGGREMSLRGPQDEERQVIWHAINHVDADNEVIETVCFGLDMTDTRRHEAERSALQSRLLQAQKFETVGTLAMGVAHDFNNLLVPILTCGELIKEIVPTGEINELAVDIVTAAQRGSALANQLMVVNREQAITKREVQLEDTIREVARLLRAGLPSTIDVVIDAHPCDPVLGDASKIHQALLNLCTNAAQALEGRKDGQLRLLLRTSGGLDDLHPPGSSGERAPSGPRTARVSVIDNGHGMEPHILERVFEPFFTTKSEIGGSGLGLWGVRQIVDAHGGHLHVDSKPGVGTEFTICLPLARPGQSAAPARAGGHAAPFAGAERVMFVDDEPVTTRLISKALSRLGYQLHAFTSSEEAFRAFAAEPTKFDILITDFTMPKMTGTDLAVAVHALRPELPVVLVSGLAGAIPKADLAKTRIDGVLAKPLIGNDYAAAIRAALQTDH